MKLKLHSKSKYTPIQIDSYSQKILKLNGSLEEWLKELECAINISENFKTDIKADHDEVEYQSGLLATRYNEVGRAMLLFHQTLFNIFDGAENR